MSSSVNICVPELQSSLDLSIPDSKDVALGKHQIIKVNMDLGTLCTILRNCTLKTVICCSLGYFGRIKFNVYGSVAQQKSRNAPHGLVTVDNIFIINTYTTLSQFMYSHKHHTAKAIFGHTQK